ncbi:MAG: hypothetical protein JW963_12455 [Anaerolineales bacterium]|nr:hypothetical protein [Anaerolineales bacterium]
MQHLFKEMGASESMQACGIHPITTGIASIEEAAMTCPGRKNVNCMERLH